MEFDIRMPQLTEMQTRLDELFDHVDALHQKLDDLALAAAAPGSVVQLAAPEPVKSPPAKRGRPAKAPSAPTPIATDTNGEDRDTEDEDALRARAAFEARRTTRLFGIAATRATVRRVTGQNILQVDEVSAVQLPTLIAELQAM